MCWNGNTRLPRVAALTLPIRLLFPFSISCPFVHLLQRQRPLHQAWITPKYASCLLWGYICWYSSPSITSCFDLSFKIRGRWLWLLIPHFPWQEQFSSPYRSPSGWRLDSCTSLLVPSIGCTDPTSLLHAYFCCRQRYDSKSGKSSFQESNVNVYTPALTSKPTQLSRGTVIASSVHYGFSEASQIGRRSSYVPEYQLHFSGLADRFTRKGVNSTSARVLSASMTPRHSTISWRPFLFGNKAPFDISTTAPIWAQRCSPQHSPSSFTVTFLSAPLKGHPS